MGRSTVYKTIVDQINKENKVNNSFLLKKPSTNSKNSKEDFANLKEMILIRKREDEKKALKIKNVEKNKRK